MKGGGSHTGPVFAYSIKLFLYDYDPNSDVVKKIVIYGSIRVTGIGVAFCFTNRDFSHKAQREGDVINIFNIW